MKLLQTILESFGVSKPSKTLTSTNQLIECEAKELNSFSGKSWLDVDCKLLEKNFEILNWLDPASFYYYLPGICSAGIRENRRDLLVFDSIIGMLDRSPTMEYWDNFFLKRWPLLSIKECKAIQGWLIWLSEENNYDDLTIERAFDTLELLIELKFGV